MAMAQQINDFLAARSPKPFCDDCIAEELGLNTRPSLVTGTLAIVPGFTREVGDCTRCGRHKLVIHANRA